MSKEKAEIILDWVKNVITVDEETEGKLLTVIKYGLNEIEMKERVKRYEAFEKENKKRS